MRDTTVDRPVDQSHFECNKCSLKSHLKRKTLHSSLTQTIEIVQCASPSFKHKSTTKLAAEVGLSPSACLRRVHMLENEGAIRGYTAIVGSGTDDEGIAVIIQITLERQTEEYFRRFESAVRRHSEIRQCYLMTGGADYLLRVNVENAGDFERIHKDILSVLPGVSRIHSSFSIRNVLTPR